MGRKIDVTGRRFERLVAVSLAERKGWKRRWLCRCDCGTECIAHQYDLIHGKQRSCGCLQREVIGAARRTHGRSGSSEYNAWLNMRARCEPEHDRWPDYFARGVYVCDRWERSFKAFFSDMGMKPSPAHSIDRIDNDGPYAPENCRWATHAEQMANRRPDPRGHANLTWHLRERNPLTGRFT